MKHVLRALAGIPVSFVILIVVAGGVSDAGAFMLLSILCTAGISLVVWIPIWYVLGWIVLAIGGLAGLAPQNKTRAGILTQYERDIKGVVAYMRSAAANGLSNAQITRQLEEAGWGPVVIDAARQQLAHLTPDSRPHTG